MPRGVEDFDGKCPQRQSFPVLTSTICLQGQPWAVISMRDHGDIECRFKREERARVVAMCVGEEDGPGLGVAEVFEDLFLMPRSVNNQAL